MTADRFPVRRLNRPTRFRAVLASLTLVAIPIVGAGCSDSADDDDVDVENEPGVPFDPSVDEGVDTNVEDPGAINFDDNEQPDFDDDFND